MICVKIWIDFVNLMPSEQRSVTKDHIWPISIYINCPQRRKVMYAFQVLRRGGEGLDREVSAKGYRDFLEEWRGGMIEMF